MLKWKVIKKVFVRGITSVVLGGGKGSSVELKPLIEM